MSDKAAKTIFKTKCRSGFASYVIADGVTLYEGALVQLESGYLNHWDETGKFIGLLIAGDDRGRDGTILGEISDTPPVQGRVDESGVTLCHMAVAGTVTIADVGALVYCADSDPANMTKTDTTNPPIGRIVRVGSATDVDVELFTPTEWLAGDAGAAWAS